jgi:hypothetical protein
MGHVPCFVKAGDRRAPAKERKNPYIPRLKDIIAPVAAALSRPIRKQKQI